MKQIKAIVQPFMKDKVLTALRQVDELPGVTVFEVRFPLFLHDWGGL